MSGTGSLRNSANREMQPSSSGYKHFKEITSHVCCCFVSSVKKTTHLRCPYLQPLFRLNSFCKGAEAEPLRWPPHCRFDEARVHPGGPRCGVSIVVCPSTLPGLNYSKRTSNLRQYCLHDRVLSLPCDPPARLSPPFPFWSAVQCCNLGEKNPSIPWRILNRRKA